MSLLLGSREGGSSLGALVDFYKVGWVCWQEFSWDAVGASLLLMYDVLRQKSLVPGYCRGSSLSRTMVLILGLKPAPFITLASTLRWTLEEALILCFLKPSGLDPGSQGKAWPASLEEARLRLACSPGGCQLSQEEPSAMTAR